MYFLLVLLFFLYFAKAEVIIEKSGNHYHVEAYEESGTSHYKKHFHKRINKKEKYYVAKKGGKVFHRPSCRFARKIRHRIIFKSRSQAIKAGLRPCKRCKP